SGPRPRGPGGVSGGPGFVPGISTPEMHLSVDERTNSVIVMGAPDALQLVKYLLNKVDVGEGKGREETHNKPAVQVFPLRYGRADNGLVQALNLLPSLQGHFSVDSN